MAASFSLTAVFETVEDGWVQGRLEEVPAVITVAPSRAEAETMLLDALQEYLLSLGKDAVAEAEDHAGPHERQTIAVTFAG